MKSLSCPILVLAALVVISSSSAQAAKLTVKISNVNVASGNMMLQVFASPAAFDGQQPAAARFIIPAKIGAVTLRFDSLTPQQYAVRVMHELNSNGEMDSNLLGFPQEPWGVSNNAQGSFGPPTWEQIVFDLEAAGTTQNIRLNH